MVHAWLALHLTQFLESLLLQGRKDDDKKVKNEEPKGVGRDIPIKQVCKF